MPRSARRAVYNRRHARLPLTKNRSRAPAAARQFTDGLAGRGDRGRGRLKTLGDTALHFELAYFVQQPSLNPLLDLQQAVNFRIIEEFRRLGVEFDYPTQRVILTQQRIAAEQ